MIEKWIEVVGAYGHTYNNMQEAKAAWKANSDFRATTGPYVNKSDADRLNLGITLRYGPNNNKLGTLRGM